MSDRNGGPAPSSPPPVVRRARVRDTPRLIRFYLGLAPSTRHTFHPFPFRAGALWVIFPALLTYQAVLRPFMRIFPRRIVLVLVAERPGSPDLVGYGTLRGLARPDGTPCVRYGAVLADGFQGQGLGQYLLRGLGEEALALGVWTAIGSIFRSDERNVQSCRRFGFEIHESDWVDPGAPDERTYEVVGDLRKILHRDGAARIPTAVAVASPASPPSGAAEPAVPP